MRSDRLELLGISDLRSRRGRKWISEDPDLIGASIAESDFGVAPAILDALHRAVDEGAFGYQTADHRDALATATRSWLRRRYDWDVPAAAITPVADVVRALELAVLRCTAPGQAVIVPTPTYPPFRSLPARAGRRVLEVPMRSVDGRYELDLDAVAAAFAAGAGLLVLCNPHNPTGTVHTRDELAALADVVDAYSGTVFADEIHAPLTFDHHRHVPYAAVSGTAASHAITAHSASKAWNLPGLKCAQLVLTRDADLEDWDDLTLEAHGASNLGIVATRAAYENGEGWLKAQLEYLGRNRSALVAFWVGSGDRIGFRPPDGTYLAWLDFRAAGLDDPATALAQRSVATVSGADCGAAEPGFCRLNFATPGPILAMLLERVSAALASVRA